MTAVSGRRLIRSRWRGAWGGNAAIASARGWGFGAGAVDPMAGEVNGLGRLEIRRVAAAQREDGTGGKPSGRSTTNTHAFFRGIASDDDLASGSP